MQNFEKQNKKKKNGKNGLAIWWMATFPNIWH